LCAVDLFSAAGVIFSSWFFADSYSTFAFCSRVVVSNVPASCCSAVIFARIFFAIWET
jgi:hypothetical protein